MSSDDHCQCPGCVDCEPGEASGKRQQGLHCRRSIAHFTDNRCDECHEEEVSEMFAGITYTKWDEHREPPL